MTPVTANRDDKQYSPAIIVATILTALDVLYFFGNGGFQSSTPDSRWLIYLFALPLLGQSISYLVVYFKARSDKSVLTFYCFCLATNFIATLSYCYLWARYTDGVPDWEGYPYVALVVIHILLLPVGLMTYLIMWTPNKGGLHLRSELREEEIDWEHFVVRMRAETRKGRPNPCQAIVEHIHWGGWEAFAAADAKQLSSEVRGRLTAELNYIIEDPDFYDERYFRGVELGDKVKELLSRRRRSLTDREVQRLNRMLLEACLGKECFTRKKKENGQDVPEEGRWKNLLREGWHSIMMWRENFFANLKDGCAKSSFWAMVFFFTVFLSISYLFGFAFAFHDRQLTEPTPAEDPGDARAPATSDGKRPPALYRSMSLLAGAAGENQAPAAAATSPARNPYTFYFAPYSAVLNYKYGSFDDSEGAYRNQKERSEAWRARKNYEHFEQLISDIKGGTDAGRSIRVRVVGSTDAEPVKQVTYASNYELSEARAHNVKYILMGKLSEDDKTRSDTDKIRRDIEWLCLAQSTELPRPPLKQQEGEDSETPPVRDGKSGAAYGQAPLDSAAQARLKRLDTLRGEVYEKLKPHRPYLDARFTRIETLIIGQSLSAHEADDLLNKVEAVIDSAKAPAEQPAVADAKQPPAAQPLTEINSLASAKDLNESLARAEAYAKYVDESSRKRVVEVTIEPVEINPRFSPLKLKDYADAQAPSRLSLLDYMYFTLTNYGDIVPVTPYAKYLCSLGNVLEIFFLVVFFNALLSVKENSRLMRRRAG
jgi:hypothetical protein